jgi:hypothetical protein
MRFEIQLRIVGDDNNVISEGEILHFDKGDDRLEVIGLSFNEAKAALVGIQGGVVSAQAAGFLARHLSCDLCGSRLLSKGPGRTRFRTAFGTIALSSPRFHCCACRPGKAGTFSPLNLLLTAHVHESDRHFHQSGHLRLNRSRHFARATAGPAPWGGARRWRLT